MVVQVSSFFSLETYKLELVLSQIVAAVDPHGLTMLNLLVMKIRSEWGAITLTSKECVCVRVCVCEMYLSVLSCQEHYYLGCITRLFI